MVVCAVLLVSLVCCICRSDFTCVVVFLCWCLGVCWWFMYLFVSFLFLDILPCSFGMHIIRVLFCRQLWLIVVSWLLISFLVFASSLCVSLHFYLVRNCCVLVRVVVIGSFKLGGFVFSSLLETCLYGLFVFVCMSCLCRVVFYLWIRVSVVIHVFASFF